MRRPLTMDGCGEMGVRAGRWFGPTALLIGLMACIGCGEQRNALSGSLGELYDLSFQTTRARLYSSQFAVEYVREDGQVPVRVVVDREGDGSLSTGRFTLERRGTITGRVDERDIPPFDSGTLRLRDYGSRSGAEVSGSFDAQFLVDGDEYALTGEFGTTQEVVGDSLGYRYRDVSDANDADAGDVRGDGDETEADGGDA